MRDIGIDDGNIGRDVEIGKRVFDTLFVITENAVTSVALPDVDGIAQK